MNILLLNDTSDNGHIGCVGVMEAYKKMLNKHMVTMLKPNESPNFDIRYDLVILNGEGTMHNDCLQSIRFIEILGQYQKKGTPTWLINSVWHMMEYGKNIIEKLDLFTVRDSNSFDQAFTRHENVRLIPDIFLLNEYEFESGPHWYWTDVHHERKDIEKIIDIKQPWYYAPLRTKSKSVQSWIGSHLQAYSYMGNVNPCGLVTGRHHGIYLAVLLDIDFIAMPSNTPKIEGLLRMVGAKVPFVTNAHQLRDVDQNLHKYHFKAFRERLLEMFHNRYDAVYSDVL